MFAGFECLPGPVPGARKQAGARVAGRPVPFSMSEPSRMLYRSEQKEDGAAPGSYCCGKYTTGYFSGDIMVTDTGGAARSWRYETPTTNGCTSETYSIDARAEAEGKSTREDKLFHIRKNE